MASVAKDPNDETQFSTTSGTPQPAASGTMPSAYSAPAASSAPAQQASQGQQQYSQQGQFHNIQRLLNANQGQGGAYAQKAISTAGDLAQKAQSALGTAQSAYQNQAALANGGRSAVQAPQAAPSAPPTSGSGILGQAANQSRGYYSSLGAASPTGPAGTVAGGFSALQTQMNAPQRAADAAAADASYGTQLQNQAGQQYTGPQNLYGTQGVDQAGLQQAFGDATQADQALGTNAGLAALNHETGGVGKLDSLIARNNFGQQLNQAQARFSGLQGMLNSAANNTDPTKTARQNIANNAQAANAEIGNRKTTADAKAAADADAATQKQTDQANEGAALEKLSGAMGSEISGPLSADLDMPPELQGFHASWNGNYSPAEWRQIYEYGDNAKKINDALANNVKQSKW